MKRCCIMLALYALSCAVAPVSLGPKADSLKKLIMRCAADIERAKRVVRDRDLIKTLTHLQAMDNGGKKYYLLEKETITGMLLSVTEGAYADIILVNRDGRVVYTRESDDIFNRNARKLDRTPLAECFDNRGKWALFSCAGRLPSDPGKNCVALSSTVSGGNTMPGVFIALIDAEKIREIIGAEDAILNSDGEYLISPEAGKAGTRFENFEKINHPAGEGSFTGPSGRRGYFRKVTHGGFSWILVSGR